MGIIPEPKPERQPNGAAQVKCFNQGDKQFLPSDQSPTETLKSVESWVSDMVKE